MWRTQLSSISSIVILQKHVKIRYTQFARIPFSGKVLPDCYFTACIVRSIVQTTAVKISQIMYRNISGTTKSDNAMKFACSDTVPCSSIVLTNINLEKQDGTAEVYCNSAQGFNYGTVHPSADCLTSSIKVELPKPQWKYEDVIHTEL